MPTGQILNMDVVPNASPIRGRIVTPKHPKLLPLPYSNLCHKGYQVIGNAGRVLAHKP